ncbi:hypothetical protein RA086_03950 [Lactiplantibacillus sp. WILCCON 0030]|uniref:Integral membrane protein n=1 Tax=Lactiplantibacillus brownii TaxID=3069269 RepID=A0ABU1A772_9LACO|nr:hypothetical protein [Lactiplantibacillus brownii]MDQ7936799.1 hypothetical protein [Lactiplantibacillus brownii]
MLTILILFTLLVVTLLAIVIFSALRNRLYTKLSDGSLISVQTYADFIVKQGKFNQSHPQTGKLAKRVQRWDAIQRYSNILLLLPLISIIFAPNRFIEGLIVYLVCVAIFITVATMIILSSLYRLRRSYREHQLRLPLSTKIHGAFYTYMIICLLLLFSYETVIFDFFLITS